ncbi:MULTISPECIES: MacB family efflux pump subunit [Acinetobacter]|jgi:macrolide transport system ATP-binding/permease protein|uniref:Pyoverdine export ATP-binding/permease protein PvdT n=3 Tax=Acinetobacter schindleri TaxID=108981 RepID=N8Z8C1_9GAMM|nr:MULTISPECIES: MacB family efflux pump subunit [Acinetobacter]EXA66901.1 ABC transporter family protein [Acinetobacter baumannii 348935]AWD70504.1 MacB family efflux pump subunit [Acinetobacter schindleri]EIM39064.1 peptide ABC transporter permease [Acinetobacter sp. HA]ENV13689.1 macrolide export ATP-binding/permease MacB [Acinetobacter schindleri NIPH 900]ENV45332.1 macrolide export ATP-binding/permease MacB [Acinetobacter schindleri CIP 107287]
MNQQQQPLLEVKNLIREFPAGESTVQILKGVNLEIYPGELVAIVGQSGSGKSTLMNILGCLDKPTAGSYKVKGRETRELEADELAQLRREYFGFIFQRYHLLGDLNAAGNVEVPAIYAGADSTERHERAVKLLTDLGLGEKTENRPSQLSGGQQQRVSIARALMNGGDVILADEPTGALDKNSGIEVMRILRELNAKGHTIILVTHDHNVAKNATRIIEISDGNIISDQQNVPEVDDGFTKQTLERSEQKKISSWRSAVDRLGEAFRMALLAMNAHRMRTFLTMLGIIIGIASVVSVVALGNGSQKQILENISSLGTNTITVFQGRGFGDNSRSSQAKTLIPADADALAEQPYVDGVSPSVNSSVTGRYKEIEASTTVNGVSEDFFYVRGMTFKSGQPFDKESVTEQAQDVVIDTNTQNTFFKDGTNPVGQVILLGSVPTRVIGVIDAQKGMMGNNDTLNVYLPYSTVMSRMLGQSNVRQIIVRIKDEYPSAAAENAILNLLVQRHGAQDVFTQNADSIRETIQQTTQTMTLLISAIAVISLVVGGIGVMNIMLVSVTERTQEIGVRMAVGARQSDILQQFLIEAVLVCILGGILGVLLSLGIGQLITHFAGGTFQMAYSTTSIVAAFVCSSLIGIVFGFIPARNAARLNPVDALSRE